MNNKRGPMKFDTMEEVIEAANEAGSHWFETGAMKFFNTVIESELIAGSYFVTSEVDPGGRFRYSVRAVTLDEFGEFKTIDTIGKFHSHLTIDDALAAIENEVSE